MPVRTARAMAVFMGAMTVLWSVGGLHPYPIAAVIGAALGVAVVVGALLTVRRVPLDPPAAEPDRDPGPRKQRARTVFRAAVAFEVVAAVAAIVALGRTGHPEFIMPTIALAVALHFFVFLIDQPGFNLHVAAGSVGTAGSALAIILMATGVIEPSAGRAIAGAALALCTLAYGVAFLRIITSITTTVGPTRT